MYLSIYLFAIRCTVEHGRYKTKKKKKKRKDNLLLKVSLLTPLLLFRPIHVSNPSPSSSTSAIREIDCVGQTNQSINCIAFSSLTMSSQSVDFFVILILIFPPPAAIPRSFFPHPIPSDHPHSRKVMMMMNKGVYISLVWFGFETRLSRFH